MNEIRLSWEPENMTPLPEIEQRLAAYVRGKSGVSLLGNGTLLFISDGEDDVAEARRAMEEARFLTDFRVVKLKEGGYLVAFHEAVAVFVGDGEFAQVRQRVIDRRTELEFLGEVFFGGQPRSGDDILVGLYARGKLQRDAHQFTFYKRIRP